MAASMAVSPVRPLLFLLLAALACHAADASWSGSPSRHGHGHGRGRGLGVNYGRVADDIPTPRRSVQLLRAAGAGSVKIYDANPAVLRALAGTGMAVSIMVPNQVIPDLAASYAAADRWVAHNLLPYLLRTRVKYLLVGNEVLSDGSVAASTWTRIVPAMENLHCSLRARRVSRVKLGTTLAIDALVNGTFPRPPSAAAFRPDIAESVLRPLLRFLEQWRSYTQKTGRAKLMKSIYFFLKFEPYTIFACRRCRVAYGWLAAAASAATSDGAAGIGRH